jgi:hypothetical protein
LIHLELLLVSLFQPHLGAPACHPTPKVMRVKECALIPFFFHCFTLGPTFGFLKEFGGMSILDFSQQCRFSCGVQRYIRLMWWKVQIHIDGCSWSWSKNIRD